MVKPLDEAVSQGVIGSGSNWFDMQESVHLLHQLRSKIGALVGQNFFRGSDSGKETVISALAIGVSDSKCNSLRVACSVVTKEGLEGLVLFSWKRISATARSSCSDHRHLGIFLASRTSVGSLQWSYVIPSGQPLVCHMLTRSRTYDIAYAGLLRLRRCYRACGDGGIVVRLERKVPRWL